MQRAMGALAIAFLGLLVLLSGVGATGAVASANGSVPPPPTVTSVSPNGGPAAGGTPVTITGTGFVPGAVVDFGTTVAAAVYVNQTTVTTAAPAGTGTVDVTVTTASGTSTTTTADQFTYAPFPVPEGGNASLPFYDPGSSRVGWNPCSSSSPCNNLNANGWVDNGNWYYSVNFVAPEAGTYAFQKFLAGSAAIAYIDGQAVAISSYDTPAQPNYFTVQLNAGTHLLAFQVVNNSTNDFQVPCATTCGQSWGTGLDFLLIDPAGNVVAEDVGYCNTHMCPDLDESNQYELWFPPIPPPGAITSGTLSAGFGGVGSPSTANGGTSPGSAASVGGTGSETTGEAASTPAPAASEQPPMQASGPAPSGANSSGPSAAGLPGSQSACPQGFTDLAGYSWASNDIQLLAGQGIVEGIGGCQFDPGGSVTKAQFAALMTRIFNLHQPTNPQPFTDVPQSSWEYQSVQAAAPYMPSLQLVGGGSAFFPDQALDRQDVATAVVNILASNGKLTQLSPTQASTVLAGVFDASDVAPGLRAQVATAISNRILIGFPDGDFEPHGLLTRAQIAVILVRLEDDFLAG